MNIRKGSFSGFPVGSLHFASGIQHSLGQK